MVPPLFVSASDELKNKTVCEDQELTLHCHPSKLLNIYSAAYGRRTQEREVCAPEAERLPPFGTCLWVAIIRVLLPQEGGQQRPVRGLEGKSRAGGNHPPRSGLLLPHIPKSVRCSVIPH